MKNKKARTFTYRFFSILLILASLVFLCMIFYLNVLPAKYSVLIFISVIVFDVFNIWIIGIRNLKKKIRKFIYLFIFLAVSLMSFASFFMGKTIFVLLSNGDSKYKVENYNLVVLKDSNYDSIDDIKGIKIGYTNNYGNVEDAIKKLKNKSDNSFVIYSATNTLANELLNNEIDAILLEDSVMSIVKEEIPKFDSSIKIIYSFKIKTKVDTTLKDIDVVKKPFIIYISGIDTYGEISSVSRSDVNMVMVINPKTHHVLLVSIPRDYYVKLHGMDGGKDKLTHAGIYGIDTSIKTIEDLLDIDINYYIKVNFTSVIDIVDALGGIDVYSEYTFVSYSNFYFKEGMNKVNGEKALDFARTRKAFVDGDRQRGKNQQAVIEAIIRKATNKSVITKYNSLLDAIDGKYQTNISIKKLTALIKMQIKDMPKWVITSYSLSGTDSLDYTYTYNQPLYVMEPDEESINEAKNLISRLISGEELEDSYKDLN